jgi:hypothetical protein
MNKPMDPWFAPCPNRPPCPHGAVRHDIHDLDDPQPSCCVDGCYCRYDTGYRPDLDPLTAR